MQQEKNFSWLLSALLVFLVVVPIAEDIGVISGPTMRLFMFTWLLAFGVWSLRGFGKFFPAGMAFAVVGIVLSALSAQSPSSVYPLLSFGATFGFLGIAAWCTGKQVLTFDRINANRVVGTVSLYLLLGVMWSVAYAIIEMLAPGSFTGFSQVLSQGWSSEWLYFSFVTMTTLGYGDLAPLSATARTFAYVQAVFGQFYIAILVAGLVSAYITERQRA